jgi:AraC family transcriptional regulator of adaptative response/methylated-DNA-[protein]-cysteine methyltransferase
MNSTTPALHDRDFHRVAAAIGFIAAHVHEQPSLERMATSAGLSPYHFARLFRRWAGISPKQYLQRLSLDEAKASLARDSSVLEAALDAGLSGPGRLHDLFVTVEAVTPGEFKARGRGLVFRHGTAATPFGTALVVSTARGIAFLGFRNEDGSVPGWDDFRKAWPEADWRRDDAEAQKAAETIWGLSPRRERRLTLWVHGSNFQVQVWQALLRCAAHSTVSYAEIAREIGQPSAARAVGTAVGSNPVAWLIPCHHVLRANGALGGYRWGVERKRAMLAWEGFRASAAS